MSAKAKNKPSIRTVYAVAALALVLGVAALLVGASSFFQNPRYCVLSGVKETKVTFVESSLVNTTRTYVYENDNWTASYELGKPLILDESLYTTSKAGVTTITNVVSNTAGFVFKETNISLPAFVPYASDISAASQRVELTFQTPSTPYVGDFEYTVYYNLTLP
jgi:hypothetical protein